MTAPARGLSSSAAFEAQADMMSQMTLGMKSDVAFQLGDLPAVAQGITPLLEIRKESLLIEDPVGRHGGTKIIKGPEL